MAGGRDNRFTIYDALEKAGYFDKNPANSYARDPVDGSQLYKGPVPYPKMLYHPEGEERITVPAEIVSTPMGAKEVGEQRELIHQIVSNEAEDKAAAADGWHDHPAKAIRARVMAHVSGLEAAGKLDPRTKQALLSSIPNMGSTARISELEAEIARLTAMKDIDSGAVEHDVKARSGADALAARG